MPFLNFFNGEQDLQFSFRELTAIDGVTSVTNFYVDETGSLIPRPDVNSENQITLSAGEEVFGNSVTFEGYVFVPVKKSDDTLKLYRFNIDTTAITTLDTALTVYSPIRFITPSKDNRFRFNSGINSRTGSFLLIFGLLTVYYITDPTTNTLLQYIASTNTGVSGGTPRYFTLPIDGVIMQQRLWVLARNLTAVPNPLTTEPIRLFASGTPIIIYDPEFKPFGGLDDFFIHTGVVTDPTLLSFSVELILSQGNEVIYLMKAFQTQIYLITSKGIRTARSSNTENANITSFNIEQYITNSLNCVDAIPAFLLSQFIIYTTTDGLYFKELASLEYRQPNKESPDRRTFYYKKPFSDVLGLFGSDTRPLFFVSLGNKIIVSSFIQNPTTNPVFNYAVYRDDDVGVTFLHYFPDLGVYVKQDGDDLIFEQEDLTFNYAVPRLKKHLQKSFQAVSFDKDDYSFTLPVQSGQIISRFSVMLEIDSIVEFDQIKDYVQVYIQNVKETEPYVADSVSIFFQDSSSTKLEYYFSGNKINTDTQGFLNSLRVYIKTNPNYSFNFKVMMWAYV